MVKVPCPNEGCSEVFIKSQFDDHVQNCQYSQNLLAQLNKQDASSNHDPCIANKELTTQQCCFAFLGCQFAGSGSELIKHMEDNMSSHLEYICKFLLQYSHSSHKSGGAISTNENNQTIKHLLFTDIEKVKSNIEQVIREGDKTKSQVTEIQEKQKEIAFRLTGVEDLLATIQASITEINRTYEEVSLTLQTPQATSYDGKYIWKIPDITRRRRDALMGKTVSLYSAPFYTDRLGYRVCL